MKRNTATQPEIAALSFPSLFYRTKVIGRFQSILSDSVSYFSSCFDFSSWFCLIFVAVMGGRKRRRRRWTDAWIRYWRQSQSNSWVLIGIDHGVFVWLLWNQCRCIIPELISWRLSDFSAADWQHSFPDLPCRVHPVAIPSGYGERPCSLAGEWGGEGGRGVGKGGRDREGWAGGREWGKR